MKTEKFHNNKNIFIHLFTCLQLQYVDTAVPIEINKLSDKNSNERTALSQLYIILLN